MSAKLNAEELAAKRYPEWNWRAQQGERAIGYSAAIREVAQPLADERDELREALKELMRVAGTDDEDEWMSAWDKAANIIAKYPKS